jgi:hypothetical protein
LLEWGGFVVGTLSALLDCAPEAEFATDNQWKGGVGGIYKNPVWWRRYGSGNFRERITMTDIIKEEIKKR